MNRYGDQIRDQQITAIEDRERHAIKAALLLLQIAMESDDGTARIDERITRVATNHGSVTPLGILQIARLREYLKTGVRDDR